MLRKKWGVPTAGNHQESSAHTITEKRAIKGLDSTGLTESILPLA